jgi:hypothetical protein
VLCRIDLDTVHSGLEGYEIVQIEYPFLLECLGDFAAAAQPNGTFILVSFRSHKQIRLFRSDLILTFHWPWK